MNRFLSFILLVFVAVTSLWAQKARSDTSALLENKVWKVMQPEDKQYAMSMEFRSAGWRTMYRYDGKETETFCSYSLHEDTIKVFESGKNYIIQELTDSTLVFQYLPESLAIGIASVKCMTDNSIQARLENEARLDSIWRKEDIWNKGVVPLNDTDTIGEPPRWARWDYDLEKYFVSRMKYPERLLNENRAGYSVVMFSLDTLGLPCGINILTTLHKDFDKEVVRLVKELPHCLPCRDKYGKRMECLCTVYVPFLPQHYRDRVKADSIAEEEVMRYDATLIAHTTEPHLEVGVPVCYLNERGDTIVPYGKYLFCQTDTIRRTGFVYENKPKNARIVCIDNTGKELFYVFKHDNGPDCVQEGLFRIMDEDGLIGFADSTGKVVIEPQYKFAHPFKGGRAKVTLKGERKEVPGTNGERHYWESKEWFYIDKRNIRSTD